MDTRVIYCGDNLEQLRKLPDACVDLEYIDPPFNSNRNYEVFWDETKEKRSFEDRQGAYNCCQPPSPCYSERSEESLAALSHTQSKRRRPFALLRVTSRKSGDSIKLHPDGHGRAEAFTGDARFEIDRFQRKEGREIRALTVREILDEQIARKLA